MAKYNTLLFDLDETLLDFEAAKKHALKSIIEEAKIPYSKEVVECYERINHHLWRSYEEGKIQLHEVINTRFQRFFKEYGIDVDGITYDKKFRQYLAEGNYVIDGAVELITDLKDQYDLYIVTNGVPDTQYKRLKNAGIESYFKGIFVSVEIGYQKPMKKFFDYVFERIPNLNKSKTLIIGDSLSSDIQGGINAGIDTCWFNPRKNHNHSNFKPNYEIHKLEELYRIIE